MPDNPKRAAAIEAAVVAYDRKRVATHGGVWERDRMSDANRASIKPMIQEAVAAFEAAMGRDIEADAVRREGEDG